jgi:dethiobiotin synthetase
MGIGSPLVVVTGTGTGVGKTHVAAALLRAWGESARVVGYKPVETGVSQELRGDEVGSDGRWLLEASTFHVKRPTFRQTFADPISPHLAARCAGSQIDLLALTRQTVELRQEADGVVVELAGGLFTPLAPDTFNVDLVQRLDPTRVIVVAPNRLGVLHDVVATRYAAAHFGLEELGFVLSEVADPDPSSGTNADEIARVFGMPVLATFPRAAWSDLSTRRVARTLLDRLDLACAIQSDGTEVPEARRSEDG